MRSVGFGLKFGVELTGDEPGMVFEFNDLNQSFGGINSGEDHPLFFEHLAILVIEFITVAVAFGYIFFFIGLKTEGILDELTGV